MIQNKEKIEELVNREVRRDRLMTDEEINALANKINKLLSEGCDFYII